MDLQLYNTLTREKERFTSLRPGQVGLYTCGPTVYAEAHIGNLRSYVFPDILKRLLRQLGFKVMHVINITDVGHLVGDSDEGEDKLERAARASARSAWEIAEETTQIFLEDLAALNIEHPNVLPRATGHIAEQIALILVLESKGLTYRCKDGIYFDTARFPEYGRLARLKVEGLREGSRVEMGQKRCKTDFALWKFSPSDSKRQMEWDSPWGIGFPGWHIECSAMSMKYLGNCFDIHTGGTDHIPVHHTNEIAQSEGASGQPFVRYWLHGQFLVLEDAQRMGKSEGNFLGLRALTEKGYDPLVYRYLVLNNHYRKYLNFSWQALKAAQTALSGLRQLARQTGGEAGAAEPTVPAAVVGGTVDSPACRRLLEALCDDLNTPRALSVLWTVLRSAAASPEEKRALVRFADPLLGLDLYGGAEAAPPVVPEAVQALAEQRWQARQNRDFAEADRLRDELTAQGYSVRDGKEGFALLPLAQTPGETPANPVSQEPT